MLGFLILFDAVGLVVGALLLFRVAPTARGFLADVLRLGVLATALVLAAAWLGPRWGQYGALRLLCHGLFCVGAPLSIALGVARWKRSRLWAAALILSGLSAEGLYIYALEIEPYRLDVTVHTVTSPRLSGLAQPLVIAVLADIQTDAIGPYEERVFAAVRDARPDLVLLLGDYLQMDVEGPEFAEQLARFRALVETLDPPLGIYAVNGDSERDFDTGDAGTNWHTVLFGGTRVVNAVRQKFVLPTTPPIQLLGLSPSLSRTNYNIREARAFSDFPGLTIAIGHAPDFMNPVISGGATPDALLIAGHTHGGQIVIPGLGPPLTMSKVPRWLAAGGVFRREGTWLAVSRGIGMKREEAPRVRFWCPPELMFLELAPE